MPKELRKPSTYAVDELIRLHGFEKSEILMVDDGSTDGTGALCDKLQEKDSRIRVFHKENGGLSSARNCGMKHAEGKYILFVDPDDYVDLNFYEELYKKALEDGADIVKAIRKTTDTENRTTISSLNDIILKENNRFKFSYEWTTAIYKKTLINLGIITCNQAWKKNKRVGTCITVNYDFKNGAINTDNILSLLATIDNKAPGLSLQAKGLLTHFVAKSIACQKDSFMITERQEGNELALNIKTFLKYKKELSDLGIITCNHQHNGTVIKINFNWEGELLKTETNNTEVHTITEEFNLISPEQLAESMGVTVPTVKGWVRKGQFPSYDHVFGRKKFWKSETVRNRIYRA